MAEPPRPIIEPTAPFPDDEGWSLLVQGCREGDADSFRELTVRTEPRVRRLLCRLFGGKGDLDDLVQETYLRAWRGIRLFRGDSNIVTWLTQIAVNVGKSLAKRSPPTVQLTDLQERSLPAADDSLSDARMLRAYEVALAQLPEELRETFVLHEAEGMKYQEVAEVLGCPMGTVMSRLHRARQQLLETLRDTMEEVEP